MAASTSIMVAVGAIGAGNEWVHGHADAAVKIGIASLASAVVLAGIEAIPGAAPFAIGLAVIALIGVTVGGITPGVPSPAAQLLEILGGGPVLTKASKPIN
jgi:hypothetical protein